MAFRLSGWKKYLLFTADSSHITHSIRLVVLEKKVEWKGLQYQIIWNYLVNICVVLYCLLDHTYTYNLLDRIIIEAITSAKQESKAWFLESRRHTYRFKRIFLIVYLSITLSQKCVLQSNSKTLTLVVPMSTPKM